MIVVLRGQIPTKAAWLVCIVSLSLLLEGCTPPPVRKPVTLTVVDQGWVAEEVPGRDQDLQQFTRETGIQIKRLPGTPRQFSNKLSNLGRKQAKARQAAFTTDGLASREVLC